MPFYFTPWIILPLLSALTNGALAVVAWKRRNRASAGHLYWVMLGCSGWSLSYVLNTTATSLPLKVLFLKCGLTFAGIMLWRLPAFFLALLGFDRFNCGRNLFLFAVEPAVAVACSWITVLQPVMRHDFNLVPADGLILLGYVAGPLYRLHIDYVYVVESVLTLLCLFQLVATTNSRTKKRATVLGLIGIYLPLLTDIIRVSPAREFSLATSVLFLTGLCFWYGTLHFNLLDLITIGRETLLEEMDEPLLVVDPDGRLAACNYAAFSLGVTEASVGLHFADLFPGGSCFSSLASAENNTVLHDGNSDHWWLISKKDLIKEGSNHGSLFILRDITRQQQLQNELRESKSSLTVALAAEKAARGDQERFIDMICHEYRTPLAIIQSSHDILSIAAVDSRQRDASLATLSQAVKRLKELFDGYLQKNEIERRLALQPAAIECGDFVEQLLKEATVLWGERFIMTDRFVSPCTIFADTGLLKTALLNIFDNAIKYSPTDKNVVCTLTATVSTVTLTCANRIEGPGKIDATRIFSKYYRGGNTQGISGSGVGLYLLNRIITELGGTVDVEVVAEDHFHVVITLPCCAKGACL